MDEEKLARDMRLGKEVKKHAQIPSPSPTAPALPLKPQRPPSVRTSAGLRDALFDAIDGVFNDKVAPDQATSIAKLSKEIISSVKLEMDAHRLRHETKGGADVALQPLTLSHHKPDDQS